MKILFLSTVFVAFLFGSIPFGKLIGKLKSLEIQQLGSGNIGFANSFRVMGLKPALLVLLGDILKGYLPTYFAVSHLSMSQTCVVGLYAVLAHIFCPWLKFNGGKGVATLVGVTLAISPVAAFGAMVIWAAVFAFSKIASVASLAMVVSLSVIIYYFNSSLTPFYLFMMVVIFFTHRKNIINLIRHQEARLL